MKGAYIVIIPVNQTASISLIPIEGQVSSEDFLLGSGVSSGRFELYPTGFVQKRKKQNVRALYLLDALQLPLNYIATDVIVMGRNRYGLKREEAELVQRFVRNSEELALKTQ